jgi:hypothetical protein
MRTLIVTSGIAAVAVAILVWMHWRPQAVDVAMVTSAPGVTCSSPVPVGSKVETPVPRLAAEDRTERLMQDIERSLRSFDEQERESVFTDMLPELIARDAPAAGRLVEQLDRGPVRDRLREHVAQKWAAQDRDGAVGWVASLERDDERRLAAADITTQLSRSDPAAAIEVADQFDIGRNDGSVEYIAQMWAETNFDAALAWVQSQPRGAQRDPLLARIALAQAARDPAWAASLVANEMEAGAAQRDAALSVLREWAARDADAAASWAARFPDGSVREQARVELARATRLQQ